jgi:glutaminyl-tRNA synthetase
MPTERNDFIRDIIDADLAAGRQTHVATRFPPEPNGYLHIGHAKSICLNFGIAQDYRGTCNLRYDDTNPEKEELEYIEAIERDVRWLGFEPSAVLYASDFFGRMYDLAEKLVRDGKAYVCSLSDEEIKEHRGTLSEPGRLSPYAARSVDENLDLFRRMRAGEFPDGAHVLRARIDMAAANMKMRDPLLYRIRHATHPHTGDDWCIYPMYDYAHPLEDAFEAITHSICTLEFENNRELYDWVIEHTGIEPAPHQYEFARLSLDYTVMSKRKLLQLVQKGLVTGWDDPRMPTIAGMRRRGYRPEAIRAFCDLIGVAKNNSVVDIGKLEFCIRDDLNRSAPRAMAVLRPLRVVLTNVDRGELLTAPSFPPDVGLPGTRQIPFGREIVIEADDFQRDPEPGYLRLAPGRTVRLRHGPCITCDEEVGGELRCHVLDETRGGANPADTKVWGVIHWVAVEGAVPAEVRLYDRLFLAPRPDEGDDFLAQVNPRSLEVLTGCLIEPSVAGAAVASRFQFERQGYFAVDPDSGPGRLVWNRIVGLREVAAAKQAAAPATEKTARVSTRPPRRSKAEYRAEARARDPELAAALARFRALGIADDEADVLSGDRATASLFAESVAAGADPAAAARLLLHALRPLLDERPAPFGGAALAALLALDLTGAAQKEILAEMVAGGGDPVELARRRGERSADAATLEALVMKAVADHADKAAAYRAGRTGLLGFFVGAVVKASDGRADPKQVKALVEKQLAARPG